MSRDRKVIITGEIYDEICQLLTYYEKKEDAKKDGINSKMLFWLMYLDLKDVIRACDCGDDAYSESELPNNTLTKINAALDTMRFGLSSIENEIKRISKGEDEQ